MKQSFVHYHADSTCPYMLDGVHLTSLRRAVLAPMAEKLGCDPSLAKHEIVRDMMKTLAAMEAPHEISELVKPKSASKVSKKK